MKKLNQKVTAGLLGILILLSGIAMPSKSEAAYHNLPKTISWAEFEVMYQNYLQTRKPSKSPVANTASQNTPAAGKKTAGGTTAPTPVKVTTVPAPTNATTVPAPTNATTAPASTNATTAPAPSNVTTAPASTNATTGGANAQSNGYVKDLPGLADSEKWLFDQVNVERQKLGIAPLQWEPTLNKLARMKSQDMVDKGYFAHQSPTYGSAVNMMAKAGVKMWTTGENLAVNSRVESAHYMLMDSPGHRANILNGNFTHVGIGIVRTNSGGVMITQMFIGR